MITEKSAGAHVVGNGESVADLLSLSGYKVLRLS